MFTCSLIFPSWVNTLQWSLSIILFNILVIFFNIFPLSIISMPHVYKIGVFVFMVSALVQAKLFNSLPPYIKELRHMFFIFFNIVLRCQSIISRSKTYNKKMVTLIQAIETKVWFYFFYFIFISKHLCLLVNYQFLKYCLELKQACKGVA